MSLFLRAFIISSFLFFSSAYAVDKPPKIILEHVFDSPLSLTWREFGHFCSISKWQSKVKSCNIEGQADGVYRIVAMLDNSLFVERLEEFSNDDHTFSYSIKSGPLMVNDYRAKLDFEENGTSTRFTLKAWYDVPEFVDEQIIE